VVESQGSNYKQQASQLRHGFEMCDEPEILIGTWRVTRIAPRPVSESKLH